MKVLLIHPPWQRFFGRALQTPPLALRCLAAYIRSELPDVKIDIYNADYSTIKKFLINSYTHSQSHNDYVCALKNIDSGIWNEVRNVVKNFRPDMVGISAMTASYYSAVNVSIIVKEINPKTIVVMGGKHPSALPEDVLRNNEVDYVVVGEGEETLKDLIVRHECPSAIKGIAYRDQNRKIVINQQRKYVDLNTLPLPIFESSINIYPYEKNVGAKLEYWSVITARGCPYQCIYCASERKVRFRSLENIEEEISFIKKKYNINHVSFEDDTMFINKKTILSLCEMLRKHDVRWIGNARVDQVDEEVVSEMKRSGCLLVCIGIESASPDTLKRINKRISVQQIDDAVQLFEKNGILVHGYFMVGFPWENEKDMLETLNLIKTLPIDDHELNVVTPLPGTALFESLLKDGKIVVENLDWTRFHQGSLLMNYSEMIDSVWEELVRKIIYKSSRIQKYRSIKKHVKLLFRDPHYYFIKVFKSVATLWQ